MKKILTIGIAILLGILIVFVYINTIKVTGTKSFGNGPETHSEEIHPKNSASSPIEITRLNEAPKESPEAINPALNTDLKALREKYPDGVVYKKLSESPLSKTAKADLEKSFDNLNRYGSLSGGKITHEFSHLDQKHKALKENKPLDFTPTNTDSLVQNMPLTGKWYSGSVNDGKYNSLYRLYESADGNKKFEITEMYLNPSNSTMIETFQESLNYNVNNTPMTIETLKTEDGKEIYNAHFNHKQRYYSLSSLDIDRAQFEKILNELTQ